MTGTVLSRKLVTTDLQANQINISGPWRDYFPETPDQHFVVELDNGVDLKATVDVTNPRLAGDGTRMAARDWYEFHRLKKGDIIYLEVVDRYRRYRLSAHPPKSVDAVVVPSAQQEVPRLARSGPTHAISVKTTAVDAGASRPVLSKTLTLTDRRYNLLSIARDLKSYFPEPGVPFTISFDTGDEIETTRDSLGRVREGFGHLRDWYDQHHLAAGDTIHIEILQPQQHYRLSVGPPTGAAVVAEYRPSARPRQSSGKASAAAPGNTQKRKRGRPAGSVSVPPSGDSRYALLDKEVAAIQSYLAGRTSHQPTSEHLCDWVQFCYKFELNQEGSELFALINPSEVNSWYFERTRKLAKMCRMKAG